MALNLTGLAYSRLFDQQNALSYYTQALELAEKTGNRYGAAQTLNNLGVQYSQLQDPDQAQACYERALQYWREIGNRVEELRTLNNLGIIHYQKGDLDRGVRVTQGSSGRSIEREVCQCGCRHLEQYGVIPPPSGADQTSTGRVSTCSGVVSESPCTLS